MKFPGTIHVNHYETSSDDDPVLNAETTEQKCLDNRRAQAFTKDGVEVAEYKLVRVRKLRVDVTEIAVEVPEP